jgi:glycine cleavage system regulatory protein
MSASLVVTVIGPDRPGIVSLLAERAKGFEANWAESRMASLAGQFAGMVHLQVPAKNVDALAAALRALESDDLHVVIVVSGAPAAPTAAPRRFLKLDLVGQDRPGILRDISRALADREISIEELETEIASGAWSGENLFKLRALLLVPASVPTESLRAGLEALANELMVDIALDDGPAR